MNLRGHVCGALILLSALAIANEKITLRWNVQPEQRFEQQIQFHIEAGDNGSLKGTVHFAERITSVSDEKITASMYVPGMTVSSSGMMDAAKSAFDGMIGMKYERVVDPWGKTMSAGGAAGLATTAVDLFLPKHEIGIGDTWESTFNPNAAIGDVKVTYVLENFDRDTATIRADLAESDSLKVLAPYRFLVERATGRYRSAAGSLKMNISGISLSVSFSHRTIFPSKLRSNGA